MVSVEVHTVKFDRRQTFSINQNWLEMKRNPGINRSLANSKRTLDKRINHKSCEKHHTVPIAININLSSINSLVSKVFKKKNRKSNKAKSKNATRNGAGKDIVDDATKKGAEEGFVDDSTKNDDGT